MRRKDVHIRKEILESLEAGPKTVNEIAKEIHANWLTVKHHLDWLQKYKQKVRVIKKNKRLTLYEMWKRTK